jgi:hypothetical protein
MQYEVGKTYTHDGDVELCRSGLHFVESPLDAFGYYPPNEGRYAEVEADGVSDEKQEQDSKRVAKSLHVSAELSLSALIGAGVKFVLDKVDWEHAKESNTGYQSAATNTGVRSAATNTGDYSAATNTGKEGWAVSLGIEGKAKGAIGCWLVLAEWSYKGDEWNPIDTKAFRVDGDKVKADTFYMLKNGKLVEATC